MAQGGFSYSPGNPIFTLRGQTQSPQKIGKPGIAVQILENRIAVQQRDILAVAFRIRLVKPLEGLILFAGKGVGGSQIAR